ncbi:hypothetical protein D9758_015135 [Tetrapyrgos nigripes]|uniref:FAD dependent oxidoreductase domain-containing protein n=1 Tax=Tetrapyrgos nigripes TaxID=182062 RepID=A0A8H5CPN1_9AGAR|nr:hypothetical protein D9758_015135 [Tetrapyrgos nigripes]
MISPSECKLDIIVIGGSIAGLSAAYFIQRAGHNVTVIERCDEEYFRAQPFSGLRIPATASRLWDELPGLLDLLENRGVQHPGSVLRQGEDFQLVGQMVYGDHIISDLGANGYRIEYSKFWEYLYQLCLGNQVKFMFHLEAIDVITAESLHQPAKVITSSGRHIAGDLVIAADGHNSKFCDLIEMESNDEDEGVLEESRKWNTYVSSSVRGIQRKLVDDLDGQRILVEWWTRLYFSSVFAHSILKIWMLQEGKNNYVLNTYYSTLETTGGDMEWDSKGSSLSRPPELVSLQHEPRFQKLLSMSEICYRNCQKSSTPPCFNNSTNQIVLIGDAARGSALVNAILQAQTNRI